MYMNKIKKKINFANKNIFLFTIFFFLIVIFIQNNKIAYSLYYIIKLDYDQRLAKNYEKIFYSGYCSKQSHGYLIYIKNNFQHDFIPKVKNFQEGKRVPGWIFENINLKTSDEKIILLNYNGSFSDPVNFSDYEILDNYQNRCFFLKKND